jgi:cytoskeletal protein CcmA (bactofilin family)
MLIRSLTLFVTFMPMALFAAVTNSIMSTNVWYLSEDETIEKVSFIGAGSIVANGTTFDDSFWLAQDNMLLNGQFGNDVWALAMSAKLNGTFHDHARILAQSIMVDGKISNGLWAVAGTVSTTTNSILHGDQFIYSDSLSLQGYIEGDVLAKSRSITLGGTIVGNVRLYGDDIIVRPGTTIIGDLYYVTTNQSIVLDANSHISGTFKHIPPPAAFSQELSPGSAALLELYWFLAALLVGIPFMMIFPHGTGQAVRQLRFNLWKCGLVGIAVLFGLPIAILAATFTIIGLPLAFVMASMAGLCIYLGKFPVALALGTALLHKRGEITFSGALLSLVTGLFLYYTLSLFPVAGSTMQLTATAFGTGSLVLMLGAGRGKVQDQQVSTTSQTDQQ